MKANAGLTALDIINPNAAITHWLNALSESGAIGRATLTEASVHFGLRRDWPAWLLFFKRISILLGVILSICGLIFFMAWNWEDMHRLAKFATLEVVFVLFGGYSVWRWHGPGGSTRWDARIALFGVALLVGGMFALYGQVYQTGADPWELFRAWTIMLIILAFPGRATAFWFMTWLAGSLWLGLYLGVKLDMYYDYDFLLLLMAVAQFIMLAVSEAAGRMLNRRGVAYDGERWLSRIIGCTAIILMGVYAVSTFAAKNYWHEANAWPVGLYFLTLALAFIVYYKFIPDLLFLSLSIFSAATFITVKISVDLLDNFRFELHILLFLGLLIVGLAFGSLKLILMLNKSIRARAQEAPAAQAAGLHAVQHSLSFFKSREDKKAELKYWLLGRGAATAEAIEACYAEDEKDQDLESPWYAKVFVSIGVWLGSAIALGAFTALVFAGMQSPAGLGVLGIILCGLSIQIAHGKTLAMRAFGQVLGVCGLIYAALLFDFELEPTLLLLTILFAAFWLLKPPFTARLAAFLGSLICLFWFLGEGSHSYYYSERDFALGWYIKVIFYWMGLLWSVHYLVVMDGRPPEKWAKTGGEWLAARFNAAQALGASAYACLIFFAGLAISLPGMPRDLRMFGLDLRLGTVAVFAALSGLMAWRYPAARMPALVLGPLLAVLAWFAPYLALGCGLVLLAFHTGRNAFLGAAVAYLGCATWMYYYNLQITLLYKSLVLMGSGLAFLALGFGLSRLGGIIKERA